MNARLKAVPPTLVNIEVLAKAYASERSTLTERVDAVNTEVAAAKRRAMPGIKSAYARAAQAKAELRAAIEAAPAGTFEKPRTHIFHGIKVGYRKGTGQIVFEDVDRVVALIEKHFPEQAEVLIKVTKKPVKKALEGLDAGDLKKLGITVEDTGDVIQIAPVDSEIDKLVDAWLAEADSQAEGA